MRMLIPALLSKEIAEPDGPPTLSGCSAKTLVAFRDEGHWAAGRIASPRVAVENFGRNEECGLRCVYHGWSA